ncbi:hypothetical protein F5148DRAFT_1202454 [Russula earlei]|uniref:Uncharacterized protein n=1 Tax=Russula earlei TaxID=71964 RepID=A0ACC0U7U0_9AGAM|nr:hypothetical protein F5148DRAFT_1202454 [Russula earlei]
MSESSAISVEEPLSGTLISNHPHADIILRSRDSHEFKVPKVYIADSSPVLAELIQNRSHPIDVATSFPVVRLSDSGATLSNLLSFIIPITPDLPSTVEDTMVLLSTAQRYEMILVLTRIRDHLTHQNPPLIRDETAFHIYSLAKKHSLRQEADQAARNLESSGKLDILSGALLYELWGYYQKVRGYLASDLSTFMTLGAGARINFRCIKLTSSDVPIWLKDYIDSIARNPALFTLSEFHMALTRHVSSGPRPSRYCQSCSSMSSKTIDNFWAALSDVFHRSIENYLLIENEMRSRQRPSSDSTTTVLIPQSLDTHNADVVLRSSDGVPFCVHKSILSMASPFFRDMFSLPQPADSERVDGLPVVHLPEEAEVLHHLITVLYPIPSVIPDIYEKALTLLAVSQKYDMAAIQSSIRAEMKNKNLHPLTATATFRAYGVASAKGLTPEMENAARLTLDFPMSFESMGDALSTFGGWALRDLARFRKRCRDSLVSCLESLLDTRLPPIDIWVGCHNTASDAVPWWLQTILLEHLKRLQSPYANGLLKPSFLRAEYLAALQSHISQGGCAFCSKAHIMHGETFSLDMVSLQTSLNAHSRRLCISSR